MQVTDQQSNAVTPQPIFPLTPEMVRRLFAHDASLQREVGENAQGQAA